MSDRESELIELITSIAEYADVIVSAHAHVPSRHMFYRDKLVTGQLGNFLFPMHLTPEMKCNYYDKFLIK